MHEIPLSKTTKFIVDNRGKTVPTSSTGIPLIATNCIDNKNLYPVYENLRYISNDTYKSWFRSHPQPNDIILTLKGSQNGATCLVPDPVNFVIAQDMVALRPDEAVIEPLFLFAVLRTEDVQFQIKNLDVSGVIPHFKKSDFDKLLLPYPDRLIQKFIGDIYYSFCRKIDLLLRQNKTLIALSETLFRQWFIEEADESWEIGRLGDILSVIESGSRPKGGIDPELKNGIPSIGAENINGVGAYDFLKTKFITEEFYRSMRRGIINDYDVLIYKDGAYIGRKGMYGKGFPFSKSTVNEHVFILRTNERANQFFLYFLLQQEELEQLNASSAQPGLNQESMKSFEITIPPYELVYEFGNTVNPFIDKMLFNSNQIKTLSQLRDTLLPKLMSGEVRIESVKDEVVLV